MIVQSLTRRAAWTVLATLSSASTTLAEQPQLVTFDSLLAEMIDRTALAEFPDPPYTCKQFSSYDRRSVAPNDPQAWFANGDRGQYLRYEERDGRREGVMMDADGPGVVVRIWSANPQGTLRIYLDGSDEPAIEEPMAALLNGTGPVASPLSAVRARGHNLYLPIPYATHCKITCDEPDPPDVYYQINYRTYPKDVRVRSFRRRWFTMKVQAIARANFILNARPAVVIPASPFRHTIQPGETVDLSHTNSGGAIVTFELRIEHDNPDQILRNCVLRGEFDGYETINCPLGDFFGTAPGLNAYSTWSFTVDAGGVLTSRWVMPFQRSCVFRLTNLGDEEVGLTGFVHTTDYQWNDRSMHFHALWRSEGPFSTQPRQDWNYATISGQGVWVGDALSITNPVTTWWGEGDEKIYVDAEAFPSHFGTGTEDYYGYAWGSTERFASPFHNQTRCDGPGSFGFTSVNRFRLLDAIPFTESLTFDMEVWHWKDVDVHYAATSYFYARPGATHNVPPITDPKVLVLPKLELHVFRRAGALEAEKLAVIAKSAGSVLAIQSIGSGEPNTWSEMRHLWCKTTQVGDRVDFRVPVETSGRREIIVYPTRSWDYGIVQFYVNDKKAGAPLDTFNIENPNAVGVPRAYSLGIFDLTENGFTLRVEVVGTNASSRPPHYYWGLDCVVVK
ncbi:MAG: glycoside hydrolase family 172 protein [Phycisphaerales bacterium]